MRSSFSSVVVALLLLTACGGAAPRATTTAVDAAPHAPPQSLDEGLAARELRRVTLAAEGRAMSYTPGDAPVFANGKVTVTETAGYGADHSIFARRADGTVFLVRPQPNRIVDRHVNAGCRGFAGGRAWFETVSYTLPAGATYGGVVPVSYDEHTEVRDFSDAQPDGSACPPPAMD
jgi:hypothetical protein